LKDARVLKGIPTEVPALSSPALARSAPKTNVYFTAQFVKL
jgi:hypothetical protein